MNAPESGNIWRILHVMRAPVGGLFRHVIDLARAQTARGHKVGIVADSNTGSATAAQTLESLNRELALGVTRVPMSRQLGPLDWSAFRHVRHRAVEANADVLHGHGAKGGAYVRLAKGAALSAYTPHGGSLFYSPSSPAGMVYLTIERLLRKRTDVFLSESAYAQEAFRRYVGEPPFARVVHNGISKSELEPIDTAHDAADIVFIGELRWRKGIDVLLKALNVLATRGWKASAILYGDGPDREACTKMAEDLGLAAQVRFPGESRPRPAFRSGRMLVIPSRQESLPYIVLEAAAARMPMITTSVGGIPEIYGPDASTLIPDGDVEALAAAIEKMRNGPDMALIGRLQKRIADHFSVDTMTDAVLAAYAEAARKRGEKAAILQSN